MRDNWEAAIPERHMRFVQLPNEDGHNAVWDFKRSPQGRFFISVCGENEKPLTARLYEYYPNSGELRLMFDVADVWIVDPRAMPPSKIHTSIDFLPDGRLIMATHNTAPAPGHRQWMYEQHYEDPREGYPGSIVMIVDPDTDEVSVRGIPVPRESIYGGLLGDDPRYYYFLGYMRGHFYRLDLITNEVRDYGKVSEFSSCRLAKDDRGRIYGGSYTGELWRYDPAADEIADLKIRFESPNGTKHRRQFLFALQSPRGTLFLVDNLDGEMIELHPDSLEVTRHGSIQLRRCPAQRAYGIGGLEADERFVLYYGLKTYDDAYCPIRLVRWDILNGGEPENLGLVSPGGKDSQYICEMIYEPDGWLHMVDVCGEHSPYIVAVDVKQLRPPGPEAPRLQLVPYAEPDYNGVGAAAYMHIAAATTRTLPLHRHMVWRDTAVLHMIVRQERLYALGGARSVIWTVTGMNEDAPARIHVVYDGGAPLSCVGIDPFNAAVATSDGRLLLVDMTTGDCISDTAVPAGGIVRLHGVTDAGHLLASDRFGAVSRLRPADRSWQSLPGLHVQPDGGTLLPLPGDRLLLSGKDDSLLLYDAATAQCATLAVRTPSIRGRAFRAVITGGAVLEDGTIVAGTGDGMLFSMPPDGSRTVAYGRLYASGPLRGFIRLGDDTVAGIYGGVSDAGHVFRFSPASGLTDLGRPRVVKDNAELADADTEWASIHYLSCLAYDRAGEWLCVASGELYGCVVRYRGIEGPK
ncbi:MAG: PQQ-like beta-propeller repeat protein [Paenibacillaceae bacterium]|nr:PQQ-like beta-propeller repeat protein [Paenibacillaceae bacterium]